MSTKTTEWVDFRESIGAKPRRIGTLTLTEDQTFRRSYETAAWFQEIIVPAGTVGEITSNGYWTWVTLDGVKGGSNFASRIGAHYGSYDADTGRGEPDTYTVQTYCFMAAAGIAAGTWLGDVELDADVRTTSRPFKTGDGRDAELYGFQIRR